MWVLQRGHHGNDCVGASGPAVVQPRGKVRQALRLLEPLVEQAQVGQQSGARGDAVDTRDPAVSTSSRKLESVVRFWAQRSRLTQRACRQSSVNLRSSEGAPLDAHFSPIFEGFEDTPRRGSGSKSVAKKNAEKKEADLGGCLDGTKCRVDSILLSVYQQSAGGMKQEREHVCTVFTAKNHGTPFSSPHPRPARTKRPTTT